MTGLAAAAVPTDANELRRAAEAGDPWAQLNLGAAYDNALLGLPHDPAESVRWYRRSAAQGVAEAQFNLAHSLATGNGTEVDNAESRRWMEQAAARGLRDAQYLMGVMLLEGVGGDPDRGGATEWLRRAAAQGQQDARALLEHMPPTQ